MGTVNARPKRSCSIPWRALVLGVVVTALVGCSPPLPPLRVAIIPWIGYQPLLLARDLGHYPAESIRLVEFRSNTESLRAMRNRDVEVAALTLDEALLLSAEGHEIAVALVLDCSAGADALVGRPEIGGLSGLAGRRIGVESSANGAYVLSRVLHLAELSPADVRIVPLPSGEQVEAYRSGQVDALVTYEPLRSQLAALGAETLFDSREIPCEIVDVLAVQREALRSRRDQLERLARGWQAAVEYHQSRPTEAAERLAPPLGMTPAEYLAAIAGVELGTAEINCRALGSPPGEGLEASAAQLVQVMQANGLLSAEPDLDRLLDAGLVRALGCPTPPHRR